MSTYDADLLILGAGPAGLTAAQYGARANLSVLVVEQMAPPEKTYSERSKIEALLDIFSSRK